MEQIEIRDEALSAYLREVGHDTLGWVVKNGTTTNFFANSRQVRADIKRYRRTSGESISSADVEPVDEDFTSSDPYAPAITLCAKIRGLCDEAAALSRRAFPPNTGTRTISTLDELASALIRK
jgi:hypothetical protein